MHTMYPPKISIIQKEKGCCKYLQQALQESKSKMKEKEEWERFGHSNFTLRIDLKRGRGEHSFIHGRGERPLLDEFQVSLTKQE
jgi:hypothetical protein